MTRFVATAGEILGEVAAETTAVVGVSDPVGSDDGIFTRMVPLLNNVGRQLCYQWNWQFLQKQAEIIVSDGDSGDYPVPEDFLKMINQTQWDESNRIPAWGPNTPQGRAYLEGRDLATGTLYVSWQLQNDLIRLYPQPPPPTARVAYWYLSKDWVLDSTTGNTYIDRVQVSGDIPQFDPVLLKLMVKARWLEGLGFPDGAMEAKDEANRHFEAVTGADMGAAKLNAGTGPHGFPYLNGFLNSPDSNYGRS